jgi:hypothetical protein
MRPSDRDIELEGRAEEALKGLLRQSSAIQISEIRMAEPDSAGSVDFVALIRLLGHSRTLVCKISCKGDVRCIRASLKALREYASSVDAAVTPLLIVPSFSSRTRELCSECGTGYLDFEGNARLEIGELFIRRRSLPQSTARPLDRFPPVAFRPAAATHSLKQARSA